MGEGVQIRFSPRRQHVSNTPPSNLHAVQLSQKQLPSYKIRIEVHAGVNLSKNTADGPIHTIYNVDSNSNLDNIKKTYKGKSAWCMF